jgi:hypothetical protein
MRFGRGISLAMAAGILFSGPVALVAQAVTSVAGAPPVGADGKPLTFDVVSIREDKSEPAPQNPVQNGPTPDGYRLKGLPLMADIQRAYIPSEGGLTFRPTRSRACRPHSTQSVTTSTPRSLRPTCPSGKTPPCSPRCSAPCCRRCWPTVSISRSTARPKRFPSMKCL